jgi:hypothetical protein
MLSTSGMFATSWQQLSMSLRSLLRAFDEVEPAAMDERFYIHAFNELDLAGRTVVDAFDRDRAAWAVRGSRRLGTPTLLDP